MFLICLAIGVRATEPPHPIPSDHEFHFVVLGDSQFDDPASFNRMIDDIKHINPAFVVQVGDMIHGYTNNMDALRKQWDRFQSQIAPLGSITFIPVPGNHDLHNAFRAADRRVEAVYKEKWGATNRFFDYKNSRFIVLNSDAPGKEEKIGAEQWSWLEQTLSSANAKHIFIFLHRPPYSLENGDALHSLLTQHPVKYVFYGHHHHYHYQKRDNITYVMTNSSGDSGQDHALAGSFDHFLQVGVRDAITSLAVIKADSIVHPKAVAPEDNYNLYKLAQGLAPKTVPLVNSADQWLMSIPLSNRTTKTLLVYTECRAADGRWTHVPPKIAPLELASNSSDKLRITWHSKHSEFDPYCVLTIPYQIANGKWVKHETKVKGKMSQ